MVGEDTNHGLGVDKILIDPIVPGAVGEDTNHG